MLSLGSAILGVLVDKIFRLLLRISYELVNIVNTYLHRYHQNLNLQQTCDCLMWLRSCDARCSLTRAASITCAFLARQASRIMLLGYKYTE
jgi:hypothetical protein